MQQRIFFIFIFLHCFVEIDSEVGDLTVYTPKKPGDMVGHFELMQRLDILGIDRMYTHPSPRGLYLNYRASGSAQPSGLTELAVFRPEDNIDGDDCYLFNGFCLGAKFFVGGHGEVWRAKSATRGAPTERVSFVLKRMRVVNKPNILRCALREIYFGEALKNEIRIARYEQFFVSEDDYWLVFRDEGVSLQQMLYSIRYTTNSAVLEPSPVWYRLRAQRTGTKLLKGLMHEIIAGVATLHDKEILHRDIKPANILLKSESGQTRILIADFSSAVDAGCLSLGLYEPTGPTISVSFIVFVYCQC